MMDANQLRSTFTGFYAERGHAVVPSASLIPHDPTVLFTIAGMVPFKPYFLGEEPPPWPRATSVQKCFRTVDIDIIGTTERHCTFFEMLGNFSFGDYFKADAIPFAWELVTEVLGHRRRPAVGHRARDRRRGRGRSGSTRAGVPARADPAPGRGQLLEDGRRTGPCGPSSELFFDRGPAYGDEGGPAHGGAERFVEIYNLVFMQYNQLADGTLERPARQEHRHRGRARAQPPHAPGGGVALRDRRLPSHPGRGRGHHRGPLRRRRPHRRVAAHPGRPRPGHGHGGGRRRACRRTRAGATCCAASSAGPCAGPSSSGVVEHLTPRLVDRGGRRARGAPTPSSSSELDRIQETVEREEGAFRRTLDAGSVILEEALRDGTGRVSGETAFRLHDTHGFPIELTMEMAAEAGVEVDTEGFEREMAAQRELARADARRRRQAARRRDGLPGAARRQSGPTALHRLRALRGARLGGGRAGRAPSPGTAEIVLDRTPFYAESGGQVGDTGAITTETGRARVLDTQSVLPGLIVHRATVEGELFPGQDALAVIDAGRRDATRRHHTGTHLLHSRAAPGARRPRAPAGLAGGAGPAALRLLPSQGAASRGAGRGGRRPPTPTS